MSERAITYVYEIDEERNIYPNMTVKKRFVQETGAFSGWSIYANDGYVIYDRNAQNTETDDEGNEVSVIYYYTVTTKNSRYNWNNFNYEAVPRDSVDEDYIFGGGDENDHEVM